MFGDGGLVQLHVIIWATSAERSLLQRTSTCCYTGRRMRRRCGRRAALWMLSACSALAWLLVSGSVADARGDAKRAMRVLLIGNSYTQANLMPHLLGRLSESVRGARPLNVEAVVKGGYTLRQHLELGEA